MNDFVRLETSSCEIEDQTVDYDAIDFYENFLDFLGKSLKERMNEEL